MSSSVSASRGKFTREGGNPRDVPNNRVCEFGMYEYGHIYIWPFNSAEVWIAQLNGEEFDEFAEWIAEVKKKKDAGKVFINDWGNNPNE